MVNRMGLMKVLTDWIQNQKEIARTYTTLSEKALGLITRVLDQPVSAVVIADDFASAGGPLVSPADMETLFSPFYKRVVQAINKIPAAVFPHSCGKLDGLLPIFKSWGIDGFCAIQSSVNNLEHMFHLFDGNIMIMAGIEPELLETQPPPAGPLKRLRQTVSALGPSGNPIISTGSGLYKSQYMKRLRGIYHLAGPYCIE